MKTLSSDDLGLYRANPDGNLDMVGNIAFTDRRNLVRLTMLNPDVFAGQTRAMRHPLAECKTGFAQTYDGLPWWLDDQAAPRSPPALHAH